MSEYLSSELARSVLRHAREFYVTRPWAMTIDPIRLTDLFESIDGPADSSAEVDPNEITLNTQVTLWDLQENQVNNLTLVTPSESQPENGRISFLSLLGSKLMGKSKGDQMAIGFLGSTLRFKVVEIH